jgi:hypothetical protein
VTTYSSRRAVLDTVCLVAFASEIHGLKPGTRYAASGSDVSDVSSCRGSADIRIVSARFFREPDPCVTPNANWNHCYTASVPDRGQGNISATKTKMRMKKLKRGKGRASLHTAHLEAIPR